MCAAPNFCMYIKRVGFNKVFWYIKDNFMSAFPNVIRMLAAITMNYILCDNKKYGANCRKYIATKTYRKSRHVKLGFAI